MEISGKSNINPLIWGPPFWKVFHFTAFGYPENPNETDKETYKQFYINFFKILPCNACVRSSREIFNDKDLNNALVSKQALIKWTYDFHDKVNIKLGKKSPSFENFVSNFTSSGDNTVLVVLVVLVVLIVLILIALIMRYTLNIL
jgi:hypothetical protein